MSAQPDEFLEAADFIAARLCRDAVWAGARCNWLGDSMEFVGGQWAVAHRAFGPELYSGTSGVALFLAEVFRKTGEPLFRETAVGGARQALSRLEELPAQARVGFYTGHTGIGYALTRIGELLGEQEFVDRGLQIVEALAEVEPDERATDVLAGSAGAIPALLHLRSKYDRGPLLELARRHGEFLIGAARKTQGGWSWNTLNVPAEQRKQDLNGFSHGAAGISWALLELWKATAEGKFRVAAEQGFAYERQWFDPRQENWPDFRGLYDAWTGNPGQPGFMTAWCHGAPGIGLSRVRAYALTGDDIYRREAEAALRCTSRTLAAPGQANYSLCHGSAGNAELLLYAARVFGDDSSRLLAEQVGRFGVEQYRKPLGPWPCGVLEGGETPGLLLGLAGIGHFYLRLHDPAGVPSVLIILPES
ncbi:MAG TPA: lanthionine synthetase LanC family protein [Pyrinomonadaceae bacterium]|nr:lanthionine synthetase LanC family protein [Pyrinomonadaceae bacterium]